MSRDLGDRHPVSDGVVHGGISEREASVAFHAERAFCDMNEGDS